MREPYAFARVLQSLRVVLILAENGAQLQFELALLIHTAISLRDLLALVEFWVTDDVDTLLEVEDALFQHANPRDTDSN